MLIELKRKTEMNEPIFKSILHLHGSSIIGKSVSEGEYWMKKKSVDNKLMKIDEMFILEQQK